MVSAFILFHCFLFKTVIALLFQFLGSYRNSKNFHTFSSFETAPSLCFHSRLSVYMIQITATENCFVIFVIVMFLLRSFVHCSKCFEAKEEPLEILIRLTHEHEIFDFCQSCSHFCKILGSLEQTKIHHIHVPDFCRLSVVYIEDALSSVKLALVIERDSSQS